jgi:RNA polymerase sigma factor (sigma-70 family)
MTTVDVDDRQLLQAYARHRDADAFAALVRRYAGLVYSAAMRVTGNAADAEDVVQTCFMELARSPASVRRSVAGWLHAAATHRALSSVRGSAARRRREQTRAAAEPDQAAASWEQVEPLVDAAIAELPEELREPLVMHYLQGLTQTELAERMHVDQSTVSRRIERALARLRERLSHEGITAAVTPALLSRLTGSAAPPRLVRSLVKMGLLPVAPVSMGAATIALVVGGLLLAAAVTVRYLHTSPGGATMTTIAKDDRHILIPGVPKLGWSTNTQTCFAGALSAALSVTDHPVSEREIMGLTALAFRVRWLYYTDNPKWCPSCPVGETPEEITAAGRNTGWQLDSTIGADDESLSAARVADLVASIDRGTPALVYDTKWNPAVAYGFMEGGAKLIVNDYFGGDGPHEATSLPPFVLVAKGFAGSPDRKQAVVDALQMAVANWHTDHKHNGAAEYWYGRSAYDHWISDVLTHWDSTDGSPLFPTWWNMDVLVEARQQAAAWLADIAPLFAEPAAAHLQAASQIYLQEHQMLWKAWGVEDAFNGDSERWKDLEYRQRIATTLADARDREARAIAEIERALGAEADTMQAVLAAGVTAR